MPFLQTMAIMGIVTTDLPWTWLGLHVRQSNNIYRHVNLETMCSSQQKVYSVMQKNTKIRVKGCWTTEVSVCWSFEAGRILKKKLNSEKKKDCSLQSEEKIFLLLKYYRLCRKSFVISHPGSLRTKGQKWHDCWCFVQHRYLHYILIIFYSIPVSWLNRFSMKNTIPHLYTFRFALTSWFVQVECSQRNKSSKGRRANHLQPGRPVSAMTPTNNSSSREQHLLLSLIYI